MRRNTGQQTSGLILSATCVYSSWLPGGTLFSFVFCILFLSKVSNPKKVGPCDNIRSPPAPVLTQATSSLPLHLGGNFACLSEDYKMRALFKKYGGNQVLSSSGLKAWV